MNLAFETEREDDGSWLSNVREIASVIAYGATEMEAKAEALAFPALAEQLEYGEADS